MFISTSQIIEAIKKLNSVHPFFGITFLVCKKESLPIGQSISFPMDQSTKTFLETIHRLHPDSEYFYQPYRLNKDKEWVRPDYPAKGLQAINTQTFKEAFLHQLNTKFWGWKPDYINYLKLKLINKKKLPTFDLAIWIFRQLEWPPNTIPKDILDFFFENFHITDDERNQLFDESLPNLHESQLFQEYPVVWSDLSHFVQSPPDVGPDQGGTLSFLELKNLEPAKHISFFPSRRLNIITGDNGLGKSFLLECAWWALTSTWAEMPAYPLKFSKENESSITFELAGITAHPEKKEIKYDIKSRSWPRPSKRPTIPGLIVYARVDGSFAVWDPARFQSQVEESTHKATLVLSRSDVWDGLSGSIEGLIRDWIRWQNMPEKYPFEVFLQVLKRLSPPDLGDLVPGEPSRIPNDPRDIPTIVHPYGTIPILFTAAGVRRVITLAYLIVWAWNEHRINSSLYHIKPQSRMVVMIDEIEAHLHPKWQRVILPAILDVQKVLSKDLEIQFFIATHSPLVLASAEPIFNDSNDKLFHLDIKQNNEVNLEEVEFIKFGQINSWLTSPIFEMRHARSKEADEAIEEAKNLQKLKEVKIDDIKAVHEKLVRYLAENDQFWPRWLYFAEKNGVNL